MLNASLKFILVYQKKPALARRTDTASDSDGPTSFDSKRPVPISTQRHVLFQCLRHRSADLFQHCSAATLKQPVSIPATPGRSLRLCRLPEALTRHLSQHLPSKVPAHSSSPIGGGLTRTVRHGRASTPVSAAHYTRSDSAAPWSDMARRSDYMPATIERSRARPRTVRAPPEKSDADCYAAPRQH